MLFLIEIIPLAIPYHSSLIPMSMQCIRKILLKSLWTQQRPEGGSAFQTGMVRGKKDCFRASEYVRYLVYCNS